MSIFECDQLEICLDSDGLYQLCSSARFSHLTALNLGLQLGIPGSSCENLTPASFSALTSLPQLQMLATSMQFWCDEYLYQISRLHSFTSLHLSWFPDGGPTNAASHYLKDLVHLEEFIRDGQDNSGDGWGGDVFHDDHVFTFDALLFSSHLRYLDFSSMRYTGTYLYHLKSWTHMFTSFSCTSSSSDVFPELSTLVLVGVDCGECPEIDLTAMVVNMLNVWITSLRTPDHHITFAPCLKLLVLHEMMDCDIVRCLEMTSSDGNVCDRQIVQQWIAKFPFRVVITAWENNYYAGEKRLAELRAENQKVHAKYIQRRLLPLTNETST